MKKKSENRQFTLKRYHRNITDQDILDDLRRVAGILGRSTVKVLEYRKHGTYHDQTVLSHLGSWESALHLAGLAPTGHRMNISEFELMENLYKVWTALGKQPSRRDMVRPHSEFSERPYITHFGGWMRALEAFVEWANQSTGENPSSSDRGAQKRKTSRDPNLRLRFKVMQRDHFSCQACGRSPSSTPGLKLHVDHVVPWSKDGETVEDNLQTLCEQCNLGKGCVTAPNPEGGLL